MTKHQSLAWLRGHVFRWGCQPQHYNHRRFKRSGEQISDWALWPVCSYTENCTVCSETWSIKSWSTPSCVLSPLQGCPFCLMKLTHIKSSSSSFLAVLCSLAAMSDSRAEIGVRPTAANLWIHSLCNCEFSCSVNFWLALHQFVNLPPLIKGL